MAETLDRFTERVAVLAQAVDGLRDQLEQQSRQVETLATDVTTRLTALQEAAEEVGRVRAVLAAQPTEGLERQVTALIDEVKATRRSVAVSSGKKKVLDADVVERIVRSVVERLTEKPQAPKTSRAPRPSVAG
jgi:DNA repair exonuclease SbcCD ATPase subunit